MLTNIIIITISLHHSLLWELELLNWVELLFLINSPKAMSCRAQNTHIQGILQSNLLTLHSFWHICVCERYIPKVSTFLIGHELLTLLSLSPPHVSSHFLKLLPSLSTHKYKCELVLISRPAKHIAPHKSF